jgi:hypothetical protein
MLLDADDSGLKTPAAFAAFTLKVYDTPSDRPETVIGADEPVPVKEPGVDVTVYVLGVPPVTEAVKVTEAERPAAVATPIVGVSGTSIISLIAFKPSGVPSMRSSAALRILTDYLPFLKFLLRLKTA